MKMMSMADVLATRVATPGLAARIASNTLLLQDIEPLYLTSLTRDNLELFQWLVTRGVGPEDTILEQMSRTKDYPPHPSKSV